MQLSQLTSIYQIKIMEILGQDKEESYIFAKLLADTVIENNVKALEYEI